MKCQNCGKGKAQFDIVVNDGVDKQYRLKVKTVKICRTCIDAINNDPNCGHERSCDCRERMVNAGEL